MITLLSKNRKTLQEKQSCSKGKGVGGISAMRLCGDTFIFGEGVWLSGPESEGWGGVLN